MKTHYALGDLVIVARGEQGEKRGTIAGTASVHIRGRIETLYVVHIGIPLYIQATNGALNGTASLLCVHADNLEHEHCPLCGENLDPRHACNRSGH
jgi:hypothetical protein